MAENIIEIKNLKKTFLSKEGNHVLALNDVNLKVKKNEFICIVGPSGCGKSTLLRIIAGLETLTSGDVLYDGKKVSNPSGEVGMVFQDYSLLPWRTVLDNIALGLEFKRVPKDKRRKIGMDYLKLIGMDGFQDSYPYELSGGMQQRVAIARALANDPNILLMDEPFGALDAHTRIIMQEELLEIWNQDKKTILFITHSVNEAISLADKIIVMTKRPGTIREIIDVNMERPRDRANPRYGELANKILKMLREEL